MLRVTGGKDKGRKLKGPQGHEFRPSTGRVKEYIFSILFDHIIEAEFLDLFAGSGSLGIEALSRGAASGTFVDAERKSIEILKYNLALCGYQKHVRVIQGDVFTVFHRLSEEGAVFDLILADPPFKGMYHENIVQRVAENRLLKKDGILIIEHEQHDVVQDTLPLSLKREKKFGHCAISIYGR